MELVSTAIGIAEAAARATSGVYTLCSLWSEAPRDVYELRDDLVTTSELLAAVQRGLAMEHAKRKARGIGTPGWSPDAVGGLQRLLLRGQIIVGEIQKILDKLTGGPHPQNAKVERYDKSRERLGKRMKVEWLMKRRKIYGLRTAMTDIRQKVYVSLIYLNVSITTELHTALMGSDNTTLWAEKAPPTTTEDILDAALDVARVTYKRNNVSREEERLSELLTSTMHDLGNESNDFQNTFANLLVLHIGPQKDSTSSGILQSIETDQNPATSPVEQPDSSSEKAFGSQLTSSSASTVDPMTLFLHQSASRLRYISRRCETTCACRCHINRRYAEWKLDSFKPLFGSLAVTFGGLSLDSTRCTVADCQSRYDPVWIRVEYHLPSWILQMAVSVFLLNHAAGPEMLLRVARHIEDNGIHNPSSIFEYIFSRDIEGAKLALQSGSCSPYDTFGRSELTTLEVAVNNGFIPMIKLLLDAGADPFQTSRQNGSGIIEAFELWCLMPSMRKLADFFPFTTYLEEEGFSDLHKILLGILPLDLQKSLQQPYFRSQLSNASAQGWTPAHIASLRNDIASMRTLIRAGAMIDCKGVSRQTPLHYACFGGSQSMARVLLDAGASVTAPDAGGVTPLHAAQFSRDNTELASLLISRGAVVDAVTKGGYTPLIFTAWRGRAECAALLISHGADLNHRGPQSETALLSAIDRDAYQVAETLLVNGADYTAVNYHGRGVLHTLAESAGVDLMRLFADTRMRGIDAMMRDKFGKTAQDLFEQRAVISPELREQFEALIESVQRRPVRVADVYAADGSSDSSLDDSANEEFFDSVESSSVQVA